ncbi:hypothetical protein [Thermasporomyces composti]|jgi:hypothetical protein|uniref:Uncharacterized protein n=1 Tax=Thermasporomyces composti TaxID=696763 RepID=A0A3D9V172_THECX|nr:hypothetical protein [Thermasporomyces composti]REF35277.1 hypothetical protein DFJ64_0651 [Thermasporomyces composti]
MADEANITRGGDTGTAAAGSATAVQPAPTPSTSVAEHRHVRDGGVWRAAVTVTHRLRDLIATAVLTAAVLAALVLALGAVLTALGANERNEIVSGVLSLGAQFVGPFSDVFTFDDEVRQVLVNWGIAAGVYLVAGRVLERLIRP